MVYYSRDFIPEMPLALWTALFLVALSRPAAGWRVLAGVGRRADDRDQGDRVAGPRQRCRRTRCIRSSPVAGSARRDRVYGGAAAVLSLLLAPPWKWAILLEAATAYARKGAGSGLHVHHWYSYFEWMAGWHYSLSEAPVLALAVAGLVSARKTNLPFLRFLVVYAIALVAVYSAIPYKTPWCAVSLLYALALLAGNGIAACLSRWRAGGLVLAAAVLAGLGWQAWIASVPYASDPRNPWVYAQTGVGVFTIRDRIEKFARAWPEGHGVAIDVYTTENFWPLPWYFRPYPNVRWWRQVGIPGRAAPIVLLSPDMEPDLVRKLYQGPPPGERELYMSLFPGYVELRPQVEVRGYVAKSLWDLEERGR